jgi:hypothetical protein
VVLHPAGDKAKPLAAYRRRLCCLAYLTWINVPYVPFSRTAFVGCRNRVVLRRIAVSVGCRAWRGFAHLHAFPEPLLATRQRRSPRQAAITDFVLPP